MVLTGYNTDIEHEGVTYHVQTEDKGRSNPYIETLIYAKGEILHSRRIDYQDMVTQGVDDNTIAELMDRQHRTMVAVIQRGRLPELTGRSEETKAGTPAEVGSQTQGAPDGIEPSLDEVILDYLRAQRGKAHLLLNGSEDQDFVYGRKTEVRVTASTSVDEDPLSGVEIKVIFKSTAEPRRLVLGEGKTDSAGVFSSEVEIPSFNGGTSAVIVSANSPIGQSEIKHLVHQ
jgi:hypothetical protein